jgi:hypothetical protein
MKKTLFAAVLATLGLFAGHSVAANAECDAKAAEKKLAGAAKASFLKKCEKDAGSAAGAAPSAACEKSAVDKKLVGAAKNSHIKKCLADAGATPAPKK